MNPIEFLQKNGLDPEDFRTVPLQVGVNVRDGYYNPKPVERAMGRRFGYILIREVCRGVRPLAYGYRWSYVDVALGDEEDVTDN